MDAPLALAVGATLAIAGSLLRGAGAATEAIWLGTETPPSLHEACDDALRGSFALLRVGAAIALLGVCLSFGAVLGRAGALLGVVSTPFLLFATDLLPRALVRAHLTDRDGLLVRFGRALRSLESLVVGGDAPAWRRPGLIPFSRREASEEMAAERQMVRRVYDFADVRVVDVMVPLINVVAVHDDAPVAEVIRTAQREGFSRLPVYEVRITNIVGVLNAFDLLDPGDARTASDLMRPPFYAPEMMSAAWLLRRLQAEAVNLAVVVDEYGGAVGIITVEDILEEVVGEIADEYDVEKDPVKREGPHSFRVSATAEINHLNERFPWQLPVGDYETLGGLLMARLGRVPQVGDSVELDVVTLRTTAATPRAATEIEVEERQPEEASSGAPEGAPA